jgi:hypothetical protein
MGTLGTRQLSQSRTYDREIRKRGNCLSTLELVIPIQWFGERISVGARPHVGVEKTPLKDPPGS